MFNIFHEVRYLFYMWSAKRKAHNRKKLHLKVGNVRGFLRMMKELQVPYVIIRWDEDLPLTKEQEKEKGSTGDIDMLVEAEAMPNLIRAAAYYPGKVKLDLKSNRQVYGTDRDRMTYYPPSFSDEMLQSREEVDNLYFRPGKRLRLYSFAYYLVYHNGASGAIPSGLDGVVAPPKHKPDQRHDRVAELHRLAQLAGEELPKELTLWNLHLWLLERNWSMPFDLMPRYPDRSPFLDALFEKNCEKLDAEMEGKRNLCVYILREDALKVNAQDEIIAAVAERFDIMAIVMLDKEQQQRVLRQTRGGDWTKRKQLQMFLPTIALICHGREELIHRGKLGRNGKSGNNVNITFKHQLRDRFAQKFADAADFMHGSDNDLESFYYFKAIFGPAWKEKWHELYKW